MIGADGPESCLDQNRAQGIAQDDPRKRPLNREPEVCTPPSTRLGVRRHLGLPGGGPNATGQLQAVRSVKVDRADMTLRVRVQEVGADRPTFGYGPDDHRGRELFVDGAVATAARRVVDILAAGEKLNQVRGHADGNCSGRGAVLSRGGHGRRVFFVRAAADL